MSIEITVKWSPKAEDLVEVVEGLPGGLQSLLEEYGSAVVMEEVVAAFDQDEICMLLAEECPDRMKSALEDIGYK